MKLKVCIVSGSRAEFTIIHGLIKKIHEDKKFDLRIIFTECFITS